MSHCRDYNVTKTQNRRCWLTCAKPKFKSELKNYVWVAKTQLALQLVTTASYLGKIHVNITAGMRLNHHGNFKVQHFSLFQQIKKEDCAPSPTVPHLLNVFSVFRTKLFWSRIRKDQDVAAEKLMPGAGARAWNLSVGSTAVLVTL